MQWTHPLSTPDRTKKKSEIWSFELWTPENSPIVFHCTWEFLLSCALQHLNYRDHPHSVPEEKWSGNWMLWELPVQKKAPPNPCAGKLQTAWVKCLLSPKEQSERLYYLHDFMLQQESASKLQSVDGASRAGLFFSVLHVVVTGMGLHQEQQQTSHMDWGNLASNTAPRLNKHLILAM